MCGVRPMGFDLNERRVAAGEHGLAVLASGTHPSADWREALHGPKDRYLELMHELQMVGRRNMLCGMHVHVEVADLDTRIEVMNRMIPYVPLLLALSTSSPSWRGQSTGLKGYRLTAYDELPRTGLPELFSAIDDRDAEGYPRRGSARTLRRSGAGIK
jgi:glutamate---cysteine ligase / carboxylate-amine ligase